MKKNTIFKIILAFLVFLPITAFAENFTVNLNGPETASTNEKVDFTLSIKTDEQAVGFETTVKYDTNILELTSILKEESWTGSNSVQNNGNNTLKFTNKGVTGESSVVTLKFKVKSAEKNATTISFESMKLYAEAKEEGQDNVVLPTNDVKKDINIKSDDNTLKNIKVDGKLISGFSSNVFEYKMEVDSIKESVKIDSTLNDSTTASYVDNFGNRTVNLEYGENNIQIKIKSESGKELVYTLNILRKDDRESNTDLKSIILNGGKLKIDFNKSTLSYTVHAFKLENVDISVETDDPTSTYKIDKPEKLIIGDNKVVITVTSSIGATKEYILNIVNTEVPTDTRLKNLSVKGINIGFNSDKYNYAIRYDKSYKNGIKIYHTTLSNYTDVKIVGNGNLSAGSEIKIIVDAQDGSSSSEYIIKLEKDSRINFFLILDVIIGIVLVVLISIQLKKRNNRKKEIKKEEEELLKTKQITL